MTETQPGSQRVAEVVGVDAHESRFSVGDQVFGQLLVPPLGRAVADGELVAPPVQEVRLDEVPSLLAPDAARLAGKKVINFS